MEKKINIAELLKGCPKGMELYSPLFGDCKFVKVHDSEAEIIVEIETGANVSFKTDGRYYDYPNAECILFPKGKTTWEGFQGPFNDGDVVVNQNNVGTWIGIYHRHNCLNQTFSSYCYIRRDGKFYAKSDNGHGYYEIRFATEEEKAKLFQTIKDNGYKWNPETKTLEKVVESRFHAGDWIMDGISKYQILFIDDIQYWYSENGILGSIESVDKRYHHWTIQDAEDGDVLAFDDDTIVIFKDLYNKTTFHSYCHIEDGVFSISELDCPDWWDIKFKPATKEQRDFLFQKIKEAGYRWNAETKTLEKLIKSHTPKKFYIRIGDIPSEEKSAVYKGDVVIGYEDGVSVYDCVETDGLYRIVMPFPLKEGQGITYENLIQEIAQCRHEIEKPRNVYLVSGMEIGKGHDNEPLIKNVKILKDLTSQFNTKNGTEETKTLEKLVEPKFKVGDIIQHKENSRWVCTIRRVEDRYYVDGHPTCYTILFDKQDEYKLVPNKFDIANLKPFEKVLVRQNVNGKWGIDFFGFYTEGYYYTTGSCIYVQCIPYEGNEHLLGTTNDCDDFYKTWK